MSDHPLWSVPPSLSEQQAEIDRLRGEVNRLERNEAALAEVGDYQIQLRDAARAEVERLKAALLQMQNASIDLARQLAESEREIARLKSGGAR